MVMTDLVETHLDQVLLPEEALGSLALGELHEGELSERRGDVDVGHLAERLKVVPEVLLGEVLSDTAYKDLAAALVFVPLPLILTVGYLDVAPPPVYHVSL